jgi:ATP-dependent DNA helicase RecQ
LTINGNECTNANGQSVLRFSRQFCNTTATQKQRSYRLKQAKVNLIVYRKKENAEQELKFILPELYFQR